MIRTVVLFWFIAILCLSTGYAQISTDCATAIPVCSGVPINGGTAGFGLDDFNGNTESGCLETNTSGFIESNSAWYRFKTGASGQLGFNIGFKANEDWDFALYKSDDCNNLGEPIRCNFFDNSSSKSFMGVGVDPSDTDNEVQYEDWLTVTSGEDYFLLVNNYSATNSGFSLQFSGQIWIDNPITALDCSIISNLLGAPVLECEGTSVTLDALTATAVSYEWFKDAGTGFSKIITETGSAIIVNDAALYRVVVSLVDASTIISDVQIAFSKIPIISDVSDVSFCLENAVDIFKDKDIEVLVGQSNLDFNVTYHTSLEDANKGKDALDKDNYILEGEQHIFVRVSSKENVNCFDISQDFTAHGIAVPTVIVEEDIFLCENEVSVVIGELVQNPNYTYLWEDGGAASSRQVFDEGAYSLEISETVNGVRCSVTKNIKVVRSSLPEITEIVIEDLQLRNTVTVILNVEGNYLYSLDNGIGQSSNVFLNVKAGAHTISIIDPKGCGVVTENIAVVGFEAFFTPNGDGVNELWRVKEMNTLSNAVVFIYDRYGIFIKQLDKNSSGWDGTLKGVGLPPSDYWFRLTYDDESGQKVTAKFINNHFALKR